MRVSSVAVVILGALASSFQVVSAIPRKCQSFKGKGRRCMTPPKKKPTKQPTMAPRKKPTRKPIPKIIRPPTARPTARPSKPPSMKPTVRPTAAPTRAPSEDPSLGPTRTPTADPTSTPPTRFPTLKPSPAPTHTPTSAPTSQPTYMTVSCPGVGNTLSYGGNLYKAVTGTFTSAAAHAAAQSYSCCGSIGNLASIMSSDENDFIRQNLGGVIGWIGFNKASDGSFGWTTGESTTYTNWNSGEPNDFGGNEDCTEIFGVGGEWNDRPCTGYTLSAFIIKFDCNNPKTAAPTHLPTALPSVGGN